MVADKFALFYELPYTLLMLCSFLIIALVLWLSYRVIIPRIVLLAKMAITVLAGVLCFTAVMFYIFQIEPKSLSITRTAIDLDGFETPVKIAFITDIHAWTIHVDFLAGIVQKINAEKPDLVLLGGDYISGSEKELPKLSVLGELSAKNGVYAVMGNHDYGVSHMTSCSDMLDRNENELLAEKVSDKLKSMNITVLRNEHAEPSDSIILVGLDDFWNCKSNYIRAMDGANRSRHIILLTHNQEAVPAEEYTKLTLVLAGHTHCGQIRLPVLGSLPKLGGFKGDYEMGLHQFDNNSYIYTSCGIGGGPRLFAPPELSIIELS